MHSGSSFKYDKTLSSDTNADSDGRDDSDLRGNRNNLFEIRKLSQKHKTEGTTIFFSWLERYRLHSDSIGKVMYESWGQPSVFAFCEYKNGRLIKHAPREPQTKHEGLARRHLIEGYMQTWEFYKTGKAESVEIFKEIEKIIEQYEQKIDNELKTAHALVREDNITKIPLRWDSQSHYDYHKMYDEIFKGGLYHTKQRELWIKSIGNYTYLVAGSKINPYDAGEILAYGILQDMEELERRIKNLQLNKEIMDLIIRYHKKMEELGANECKAKYFRDISNIWREINEEGQLLKGHGACENLPECSVPP
jgi:hypothetical protein